MANTDKNWLGNLIFDNFDPLDRHHNLYHIETDLQAGSDAHQLFLAAILRVTHSYFTTVHLTLEDLPNWTKGRLHEAVYALGKVRCVQLVEIHGKEAFYEDFGILWDMGCRPDYIKLGFHDRINVVCISDQLLADQENKRLNQEIKIDCQTGEQISF